MLLNIHKHIKYVFLLFVVDISQTVSYIQKAKTEDIFS